MIQVMSSSQAIVNQISILKQYLMMKVNAEDWHGVADAAMDLRELQAKLEVYITHETMQKNAMDIAEGTLQSKESYRHQGLNPERR